MQSATLLGFYMFLLLFANRCNVYNGFTAAQVHEILYADGIWHVHDSLYVSMDYKINQNWINNILIVMNFIYKHYLMLFLIYTQENWM